jgi:nucleotide-binding universal stress UspA family protein
MNTKPVVLATDGSPSAANATLEAVELARALEAPLVAVSVEHLPSIPGSTFYGYPEVLVELRKAEHERIDEALEAACAVAGEAGVAFKRVHAEAGASAADQICRVAAEMRARMIVIGAHGWNPVRRALHGSVSTAVVHQAGCPVLVVSARVEEAARSPQPIAGLAHARS